MLLLVAGVPSSMICDTSSGDPAIALWTGNSTLVGGVGNSSVFSEGGDDVYDFLNGHVGGQEFYAYRGLSCEGLNRMKGPHHAATQTTIYSGCPS